MTIIFILYSHGTITYRNLPPVRPNLQSVINDPDTIRVTKQEYRRYGGSGGKFTYVRVYDTMINGVLYVGSIDFTNQHMICHGVTTDKKYKMWAQGGLVPSCKRVQ